MTLTDQRDITDTYWQKAIQDEELNELPRSLYQLLKKHGISRKGCHHHWLNAQETRKRTLNSTIHEIDDFIAENNTRARQRRKIEQYNEGVGDMGLETKTP